MIQLNENWRIIAALISIAAIATWAIALLGTKIISPSDLPTAAKYLGIASLVAASAPFLVNRYLWHRWPFRQLLRIPDFSGRWEGWYYRPLQHEWRPTAHEITQHGLDIQADAWGPTNWSRGICASILTDRHGNPTLIWSYTTDAKGPTKQIGDTHSGTHYMDLIGDGNRLEGRYINGRVREDGTMGTVGFIHLIRVDKPLRRELGFTSETEWSMKKPSKPPAQW